MAKTKRDRPIIAFESQQAWSDWLAAQAADSEGLWLKLAKKSSGIASVSKSEAVDTALCHGWIDGQLDSFDDKYTLVRFTPRRQASKWSERNCSRALELIKLGRMLPAGVKEVERAQKDGRWGAAYAPQSTAQVPDDLRIALKPNAKAGKAWIGSIASRSFIVSTMQRSPRPGRLESRNLSRCWRPAKPSIRESANGHNGP